MAPGQRMHSAGTGTKHKQHSEHGARGPCRPMHHAGSSEPPHGELWDVGVAHRGEAEVHFQQHILITPSVRLSGRTVRVFGMEEEAGAARHGGSG